MPFSTLLVSIPVGLLLSCLVTATPTPAKVAKRDPTYNVLNGMNFPDPSIITLDGTSYVFGTVSGDISVPMASNPDFYNPSSWSAVTDAFPSTNVPAFSSWAAEKSVWGPDINQLTDGDGSFVLYHSPALKSNGGVHCIGVARSLTIGGPYNDSSTEPWVCPEEDGGAIDASGFLDQDNTRYVLYKVDGPAAHDGGYCANHNNIVTNTSIMIQQVQNDGYTKVGASVEIWNNRGEIDRYNTEAPSLVQSSDGKTHFLLFSTGCFTDDSYTVSYVTSTNGPLGPFEMPTVLLDNEDYTLNGPGSLDITATEGQIVFHSLIGGDISKGRALDTGSVTFSGRTITIN